jgi:hypothetical protein
MDKKLFFLIRSLSPTVSDDTRSKIFYVHCYAFIKKELSLMPIFLKIPVYILIKLFFSYAFIVSKCSLFEKLNKIQQEKLIIQWENLWGPGHTVFRLLRSLVCLYYFEHSEVKNISKSSPHENQ